MIQAFIEEDSQHLAQKGGEWLAQNHTAGSGRMSPGPGQIILPSNLADHTSVRGQWALTVKINQGILNQGERTLALRKLGSDFPG